MAGGGFARALSLGGMALMLGTMGMPVQAQDADAAARIKKIEAEVRALQRKVFPGGDGKYFEPEIAAGPNQAATVTTPSTTAVTDILARLDALEAQLQRLTAQGEEHGNAIRVLSERLNAYESGAKSNESVDKNLGAMTGTPPVKPNLGVTPKPATADPKPAAQTPVKPATVAATTKPSSDRLTAVQAILKPQTTDAGDDEYSYGFRLWEAKFYPEAQQQLALFLDKYPAHSKVTYARNLLGRAYLDEGKAKEAAPWFLKNYQADKAGARAGDSLLFLAEAMIALKDTKRACIALAEFSETYPALASGRLQAQYEAGRGKVKCN